MQMDLTGNAGSPHEAAGFVLVRVGTDAPQARRYVRSIHTRGDGAIAALAYGTLDHAQIFAEQAAAQRLAARLEESRVFGAQSHRIEPLAGPAGGTAR